MKIALDFDGVLADPIPKLLESIETLYGVRLVRDDIRYHDLQELLVLSKKDEKILYDATFSSLDYVPPILGALDGVTSLVEGEHSLIVATKRHYGTKIPQWLTAYGFPQITVYYLHTQSMPDVDVMVDDSTKKLAQLVEHFKLGIILSHPWNVGVYPVKGNIVCARDWPDVLEVVRAWSNAKSRSDDE